MGNTPPAPLPPESSRPHTGGCLCRAVRYAATGAPINVRICHCRTCQLVTGQAFFARAMFAKVAVSVQGDTAAFASSDDLRRRFCSSCGTPIFAERVSHPLSLSIALATFDEPGRLRPTMHIWTSSKVPWLELKDGLPQFPDWPA